MAREVTPMDVRLRIAVASDELNVAAFCREQGVSRQTFYVWHRRYRTDGVDGLEPRSRAPKTSPKRLGVDVEDAVVALRKELTELGLDNGPTTIQWHLGRRGLKAGGGAGDDLAGVGAARVRGARASRATQVVVAPVRGLRPQRTVANRCHRLGDCHGHGEGPQLPR